MAISVRQRVCPMINVFVFVYVIRWSVVQKRKIALASTVLPHLETSHDLTSRCLCTFFSQRLVLKNLAVSSELESGAGGRGVLRTALPLWAFDVIRWAFCFPVPAMMP